MLNGCELFLFVLCHIIINFLITLRLVFRIFGSGLCVGVGVGVRLFLWVWLHLGLFLCLTRRSQLTISQLKDALNGAVDSANLIDESRHHLLSLEHVTAQHPVLHQWTVVADGLLELVGVLVNECLQLLVVALGGIAIPIVLFGSVVAYYLDISGAVHIFGTVGSGPERSHRTDAAEVVLGVPHHHTVATASEVDEGGTSHAIDIHHGRFLMRTPILHHQVVILTACALTTGTVDDEEVADDLRDSIGIENLVAPVLGAIRACATVTGDGAVDVYHVDDLIVVGQLLVVPIQMVLDAVDVADIEFVLKVGSMALAILFGD